MAEEEAEVGGLVAERVQTVRKSDIIAMFKWYMALLLGLIPLTSSGTGETGDLSKWYSIQGVLVSLGSACRKSSGRGIKI